MPVLSHDLISSRHQTPVCHHTTSISEGSEEDAQGEGADHAQVVHGPVASGQQAQIDGLMDGAMHQVRNAESCASVFKDANCLFF